MENLSEVNPQQKTALDVLGRVGSVSREELSPEQELVADLGIDSPKALQLLVELEEALQIEISDEDAANMDSVGDILSYVGALEAPA